MSGVLDRMVQRVRGGMPAIAPLVRSDRTAAQLGTQPGGHAVPVESHEERSVPVRREARPARNAGVEPGGVDGEPATREARFADAENHQRERRQIPTRPAGSEGVPAGTPVDDGEEQPKRNADVRIDAREGAKTQQLDGDRKRNAHAEELQEDFEGAPERASQAGTESTRIEIPTSARAGKEAAETRLREAPTPDEAAGDAERVEIQISIGTVELRAPRPAAPAVMPAAPAFRPRVTLDDYLKRGSGSNRLGGRS